MEDEDDVEASSESLLRLGSDGKKAKAECVERSAQRKKSRNEKEKEDGGVDSVDDAVELFMRSRILKMMAWDKERQASTRHESPVICYAIAKHVVVNSTFDRSHPFSFVVVVVVMVDLIFGESECHMERIL